ncbi:MAG: hypothetical protein WCJ01_03075 [Ignavibacteria bacterium]
MRGRQAKGRVERGNRTHQDRLVKEMRLQVKNDYTFSFDSVHHQIERSVALMPHPGDNVIVREYLDRSVHIFNKSGEELVTRQLKERKKLSMQRKPPVPGSNHPWRSQQDVKPSAGKTDIF